MRTWILVVVGALLVAAVPTTALLLASHESTQTRAVSSGPGHSAGHGRAHGAGHGFGHGFGHMFGRGHRVGPGPGFGGPGPGMGQQMRPRYLQQWQNLTPEQRAKTMAALARQHAKALQAWADCLAKAKSPSSCRPPVPPGLAERH